MNSNITYSQRKCLTLCLQVKIEQNCSCYYTGLGRVTPQILPCLNKTQLTCFSNTYRYVAYNQASFITECTPLCPLECDSIDYATTLSSLIYPSRDFYNLFSDEFNNRFAELTDVNYTVTYDLIKEYFYSINVYYSSTQYTYINEQPQMTLVGLFSNLGGSLGMFVGFSVFSLLEIFELVLMLSWAGIFTLRNWKRQKKETSFNE